MTNAAGTASPPGRTGVWRADAAVVIDDLGTSATDGLDGAEAAARLAASGPNALVERPRRPTWMLFLEQFTSPMILVLIGAAVVTALIGHTKDTAVILAIVVFNGIVGFVQEYRAGQAMDALRRMASPRARVVRDGSERLIPAADVVPGDIVLFESGDVITADARLIEAPALRVDEAALTGESEPVTKVVEALPDAPVDAPADQRNLVFAGTSVTDGRARAVVVETGMRTAIGAIAELLQAEHDEATPLQRRLGALGRTLAIAAIVISAVVFLSGVLRGDDPGDMFLVAVSLAVAAIPEGLPAVVTISLALGARRMAQRRALVRRLPAVETLGSVTVICSDKTGTLTENRMLVERLWTARAEYRLGGSGYAPDGVIEPSVEGDPDVERAARVAVACNDATLVAPRDGSAGWGITGDPTEGALLAFAAKVGITRELVSADCPRVAELAFDAHRKRMLTITRGSAGMASPDGRDGCTVAVKGALEAVVPLLAAGQEPVIAAAEAVAERYATEGYRVMALADAVIGAVPEAIEDAEADLRLVGVVAMADPPRPAARDAIAECRAAGIRPIMITGDHPATAAAIARRLGILTGDERELRGDELAAASDDELVERVADVSVFARTNPEQKLRIVDALRRRGAVVAMTGDGVNDAPALRRADIGVAMGITGTDVSKEAADMILADDDFATIVRAVAEGRRIYANIRRFVRYLLTTNSAEIMVMLLAPFLGLPLPLLAIQILWINLVTDGAPALSLGVERIHAGTMRRPPRRPDASIVGEGLWQSAIVIGLAMAAVTLGVQALAIEQAWAWQTMVFSALAFMQLTHALSVRSERESTFRLGFTTNRALLVTVIATALIQVALVYVPALQPVFETEALGPAELALVLLVAPVPFIAVEIEKWLLRRREGHPEASQPSDPAPAPG